ncbi:MAG: hypothetical protein FJY74_06840 [Candidatus Eisenbacteria bacterium]|nr:hypothetical protein [Candidatus Eisenbacteria bacterium]
MRSATAGASGAAVLLWAACCLGTTIRVDIAGGGDYRTIQEGMDAAASGDTVVVASGTYPITSSISYGGKEVVLRAEYSRNAVINCQGMTRAVRFEGEGAGAKLIGFVIVGGNAGYGGGVNCSGGTLATVSDCYIVNCTAELGGGIYVYQSDVTVTACEIMWCSATEAGGGIYSYWSADASFAGLVLAGNSAPAGGGMYLWGSSPAVQSCTLYRNTDALHVRGSTAGLTVLQSILAFSTVGKGISCSEGGAPFVGMCDVFGNAGGDDICGTSWENASVDPRFCNMEQWDVELCANSPCLPGGISPALIGAMGQGCGDCEAPAARSSWGAVKALYR